MSYIAGEERGQTALLPASLEDYVPSDASVRVIDAFVEGLDMAGLGFGRSVPAATGRPGYDPRDLLKLYVWGYFNEARSSRRLERECRRNVEAMWLLRRLAPDFKTIADFRRDNGPAIVGACRAFMLVCRDAGLFAARLVALDGSKFRAAASAKKIVGRARIAEETARLDGKIAAWLAGLDEADAAEPDDAPGAVATAIAALQARRAELGRLAAKLEDEGRSTLVEGEEDARPMGMGRGAKPPSYNVQTAVDADTGLILHHEVTDEATDNRMLHPMAEATKQVLEREAFKWPMPATPTERRPAPARPMQSRLACQPTAPSTITATGPCSTAQPLSMKPAATPSVARRAAGSCAGNCTATGPTSSTARSTVRAAR